MANLFTKKKPTALAYVNKLSDAPPITHGMSSQNNGTMSVDVYIIRITTIRHARVQLKITSLSEPVPDGLIVIAWETFLSLLPCIINDYNYYYLKVLMQALNANFLPQSLSSVQFSSVCSLKTSSKTENEINVPLATQCF